MAEEREQGAGEGSPCQDHPAAMGLVREEDGTVPSALRLLVRSCSPGEESCLLSPCLCCRGGAHTAFLLGLKVSVLHKI